MRFYFERSGGFMGRRIAGIVDTNTLSDEEALALQEMVQAANFFTLPELLPTATGGSDQFSYKLFVDDGEQQHLVETTDVSAPDELRPLLRRLTVLTRSRKTTGS
jgi:hypothetical protein